ncbi:MAG: ATP-dependent RNA helicase DeaD [Planctomycetota bacterium]|jgi:ATP-dependent RNA helicase DeaD
MTETESPQSSEETTVPSFESIGLPDFLLASLKSVGYEAPSPIQARTIPPLLAGRDVLGQAQTGTGKTAAFALPVLAGIDIDKLVPQALVLTPTRELAIQVAEAFQRYASALKGFHVLPIYGGQAYPLQLRPLRRGVHVVVATPGRLMDHMKRGSIDLSNLRYLVLDEADEMLNMGFLDDVESILQEVPEDRQTALFSATMPNAIRNISNRFMREPEHVAFQRRASPAESIHQRYQIVGRPQKLEALTRFLEAEEFEAMIIFVRTKIETVELSEKLEARGYASSPLNGDMAQNHRELTVDRLKNAKLDIIVATDVAARGLDVPRISHVINYDAPTDTEAYVHRIGRTGRAGRKGNAILFVTPREKRMLRTIERNTSTQIERLVLPTNKEVNQTRIARFKDRITDSLKDQGLPFFTQLVQEYVEESKSLAAASVHAAAEQKRKLEEAKSVVVDEDGLETESTTVALEERVVILKEVDAATVAGALAILAQGEQPLLLPEEESRFNNQDFDEGRQNNNDRQENGHPQERPTEPGMERFRLEVGFRHGAKPGSIVGAIANEAGLEGRSIGRIEIYDFFSTVDLPERMPPDVFDQLTRTRVCNQDLRISRITGSRGGYGGGGGGGGGGGRRSFGRRGGGGRRGRGGPRR